MKMKRSEKLGMFTGLVVGVLLLLISVFMIFQTTCKVWGAEKPANATQQGIDVSSHQGKIDWEQVKNSALADYAIIRCGYGVNQTCLLYTSRLLQRFRQQWLQSGWSGNLYAAATESRDHKASNDRSKDTCLWSNTRSKC